MPAAPGTMISPTIRLVRPLGAGGMGAVWVADHLALRTQVVVKLMADALASSQSAAARFSREAAAASQVKSPHVVQMLDYGVTDQGTPYIVMELLEGHDLGEELRRTGRMPLARFATLFEQIASALSRAHERGVIHRDIKPENVFLCEVGNRERFVKVLDFGIAKGGGSQGDIAHTATGAAVGTPYYMSPEQLVGARDVDHRTDIWALGVVAFQALTGVRPFAGETYGAIAIAINQGPTQPPSQLDPSLPRAIDAWYFRACARDPRQRFSSANEMASALTAIAASAPATSAPPPAGHVVVSPEGASLGGASAYGATAMQAPPAMTPPGYPPPLTPAGAVAASGAVVTAAPKSSLGAIVAAAGGLVAVAAVVVVLAVFVLPKKQNDDRPGAPPTHGEVRTDEIVFTKVPYAVGSVYAEETENDEQLKITVPQAVTARQLMRTAKKVEILATDGKAVTRIKVTYDRQSTVVTKFPQAPVESPTLLSGKTYVVEAAGGVVTIFDEHRKPAPSAEDALVRLEWGMLGRPDPVLAAMPDVPLRRGQDVNAIAEMMKDVVAGAEIAEFDNVHAILKDIATEGAERVGVFEISYRMRGSRDTTKIEVDTTGTLVIRASDARVLRYDLAGPMRWSGRIEATGQTRVKSAIAYE